MTRFKLFMQNFLVYGMGGMIGKFIPFLMLPFITRLMPSAEYFGINDLATVMVSFGGALAGLGLFDAMFRLFFEKEDLSYQKEICSTALFFAFLSALVVSLALFAFQKPLSYALWKDRELSGLLVVVAITVFINGIQSIISAPTRMRNQKNVFLVINFVSPIISFGIALFLLLKGEYIMALSLGGLIASGSMLVVFSLRNHSWFHFKSVRLAHAKALFCIGLPLMPNFLAYWVFSSSDRLMITHMLGIGENGVYAVGAKIGQLSQLIYIAFAGGWQYFAFSTMQEEDQVEVNSAIMEYLGVISFAATAGLMAFSEIIFKIMFTMEYQRGQMTAPYLFLAPLLLMMFQVAGNQFIIVKKTGPMFWILISGVIANIGLNFILIPKIGIEGAALATLLGYTVTISVCCLVLSRMKLLVVSRNFLFAVLAFGVYGLAWRFFLQSHFFLCVLAMIVLWVALLYLYREPILKLLAARKKKTEQ